MDTTNGRWGSRVRLMIRGHGSLSDRLVVGGQDHGSWSGRLVVGGHGSWSGRLVAGYWDHCSWEGRLVVGDQGLWSGKLMVRWQVAKLVVRQAWLGGKRQGFWSGKWRFIHG